MKSLIGIILFVVTMFLIWDSASTAQIPSDPLNGNSTSPNGTIWVRGTVLAGDSFPDGSITNEPMMGVLIANLRSLQTIMTDADGKFLIKTHVGDSLVTHYIGFLPQTFAISQETRNITITLAPDTTRLTAEDATILCTQKRRDDKISSIDFKVTDERGNTEEDYDDSPDIKKLDYSDDYEASLTQTEGKAYEDCTESFINGELTLDTNFFKTYGLWGENSFDSPVNGVFGDAFKRIEIYTYPDIKKSDSRTYSVRGRTKVQETICDFAGEITIKKIYKYIEEDSLLNDVYVIIAECNLVEDPAQKGSGEYRGIIGAYGYVAEETPGVIQVDDLNAVADGYANRSFVGTWRSCSNPALVKRCIWGDYRLPFSFDFDIGDGEMMINPKYTSPEWEQYRTGEELDIVEPENGNSRACYKNPWW